MSCWNAGRENYGDAQGNWMCNTFIKKKNYFFLEIDSWSIEYKGLCVDHMIV